MTVCTNELMAPIKKAETSKSGISVLELYVVGQHNVLATSNHSTITEIQIDMIGRHTHVIRTSLTLTSCNQFHPQPPVDDHCAMMIDVKK